MMKCNKRFVYLILLLISSFLFLGCFSCPPPTLECDKVLMNSGKVLNVRITRHYSLRPKRKYYVYRDSLDNYIQEGEDLHYFLNGQLKMREYFFEGKRRGLSELWYFNGQKKGELFYKNGVLDGDVISWYNNGKIKKRKTIRNWIV